MDHDPVAGHHGVDAETAHLAHHVNVVAQLLVRGRRRARAVALGDKPAP